MLKKLASLCRDLGGQLIELTYNELTIRTIEDKSFNKAPFCNNLGVDWARREVFYVGTPEWTDVIHEMGHVFASSSMKADEQAFFGWEFCVARLIATHPTLEKFEKLCLLAEEIGLSIWVEGNQMVMSDATQPGIHFFVDDIEEYASLTTFPPTTEYKITYENPEYMAERERENQEYARKLEEERKAEQAAAAEKARKEREEQARRVEEAERKELARLKNKYER